MCALARGQRHEAPGKLRAWWPAFRWLVRRPAPPQPQPPASQPAVPPGATPRKGIVLDRPADPRAPGLSRDSPSAARRGPTLAAYHGTLATHPPSGDSWHREVSLAEGPD